MSSGSKYRHIFGQEFKLNNTYRDLDSPLTRGESNIIGCNTQYLAVPTAKGAGKVYVRKLSNYKNFKKNDPFISFGKSKILDVEFNPFINNMLAMSSEDTKTYILLFDENGITKKVTTPTCTLAGHTKKVVLNAFNPVASNILSTASLDRTIKIWNIEKSANIFTFSQFNDNIYSMSWNTNGSLLIGTSKDKTIKIFDPRNSNETVVNTPSFEGIKSSKSFFIDNYSFFGSTGFNNNGKREIRIWDMKKNNEPLKKYILESGTGITFPMYDDSCNVLYCCQRGTGIIQYVEIVNDSRVIYNIGQNRAVEPQKGNAWIPKRGLHVFKCEVQRCLRLTNNAIKPISFIVPRKAGKDVFQEDIYPNAHSGKPSLDANTWENGENKNPILMSLDPNKRDEVEVEQVNTKKKNTFSPPKKRISFKKKPTYQELEKKVEVLENKVKELQEKLDKMENNCDKNEEVQEVEKEEEETVEEEPKEEIQENEVQEQVEEEKEQEENNEDDDEDEF